MRHQSDIINQFIQSKHSRKRRLKKATASQQSFNRLLGAQVLKTNDNIKVSKLKNVEAPQLSSRTTAHGFNKLIGEARRDLSKLDQLSSKLAHGRFFEIVGFVINDVILNSLVLFWSLVLFSGINLLYLYLCISYNYFYHSSILGTLAIFSYGVGIIASLFIKDSSRW